MFVVFFGGETTHDDKIIKQKDQRINLLTILQKNQLKTLSTPFQKARKLSFIGLFILWE